MLSNPSSLNWGSNFYFIFHFLNSYSSPLTNKATLGVLCPPSFPQIVQRHTCRAEVHLVAEHLRYATGGKDGATGGGERNPWARFQRPPWTQFSTHPSETREGSLPCTPFLTWSRTVFSGSTVKLHSTGRILKAHSFMEKKLWVAAKPRTPAAREGAKGSLVARLKAEMSTFCLVCKENIQQTT